MRITPKQAATDLVSPHLVAPMHPPRGWLLEPCCRLDESEPGFLRHITRSRPGWRHAVAMSIANGLLERPSHFMEGAGAPTVGDDAPIPLTTVARLLTTLEPRSIIAASFGSCPDGLIGAARKLRSDVLSPDAYRALHAVFSQNAHIRRRRVIEQLRLLDEGLFEAAMILDLALISPKLVVKARTGEGAEMINRLVASLRRYCSNATDAALNQALNDLTSDTSLARWAQTWLQSADQGIPDGPWAGGDGLVALKSGELLAMAGKRTRTCIASRLVVMLEGRAAYFLQQDFGLIACVVRTRDGGWLATQVAGERNGHVPPPIRDQILNTLERNGIPAFRPCGPGGLSELLGGGFEPWMEEFDLDEAMALQGIEPC